MPVGEVPGMGLALVIAEDAVLVREGVRQMVGRERERTRVAACGDLPSARLALAEHRPDVLVTDVRMPPTLGDEGIQVAVELRETSPRTGVVVLSQYAEPAYARALLGAGSAGRAYLLKER